MKVNEWLKSRIMKLKEPRCLLVNLAEFALVVMGVTAYAGERLFGIGLNPKIFWTCLCVYLVYPLYKLIDHVMKTVSDIKNGIWKGEK